MQLSLMVILLLSVQTNIKAQIIESSSNEKPYWLEEGGLPQSDYFIYKIGQAENISLNDAKKQAINDVLQKIANEDGITYSISSESNLSIENKNENGKTETVETFTHEGKTIIDGKEMSVPALQEASDYYILRNKSSGNIYEYWVLVRLPKQKKYVEMPIYQNWNSDAIWRSAIFPGWGQLYKSQVSHKERKKGLFMLTGEVVMLTALFTSQIQYSSYHDKAYETISVSQREIYLSNRDAWGNLRYAFVGGAAVVYLYSIIDAATNKEAKKYSFYNDKYIIYPAFSEQGTQLCLSIKIK